MLSGEIQIEFFFLDKNNFINVDLNCVFLFLFVN